MTGMIMRINAIKRANIMNGNNGMQSEIMIENVP